MIGIDGQYIVSFSIAEEKDFLLEEELISFTVIEEAGNVLPTFELEFYLTKNEMLKHFNEGNTIIYSFGDTLKEQSETYLRILKKDIRKYGKHKYKVYLAGLYDMMSYVSPCRIARYVNLPKAVRISGMDAIQLNLGNRFKWKCNRQDSSERQIWVQYNIPDKKFVNQVWMHIDLPGSFPAIGITIRGEFIFKDIAIAVTKTPRWKFTGDIKSSLKGDKGGEPVLYDGDYEILSNTGFINHWLGYEINKSVRTLEDADDRIVRETLRPLTQTTLDRSVLGVSRYSPFTVTNDNVHSRYWEAYYQNLSHLAVYGSTKLNFHYYGVMHSKMRVLDLAYFEDEVPRTGMLADEYSGLYFITKLSRTISVRAICTAVELSREALGQLQGALR